MQADAMTSHWGQLAKLLTLYTVFVFYWTRVDSAEFTFGGEARRVCRAYKLICPSGKTCALQTIGWPRPMKFPVCVYRKEKQVKTSICRKPPQPGRCKARFLRWYYNVHMQACSWFTYGGCGGNQNNFRSLQDCTKTCVGENATDATNLPYGRLKNIYKQMKESATDFANETSSDNSIRRIPVQARAPEVINLTREVTASLNLNPDPFTNGPGDISNLPYDERKALKKLARKLKRQELKRKRKLEREERRRMKRLRRREERLKLKKKSKVDPNYQPKIVYHEEKLPGPLPPIIAVSESSLPKNKTGGATEQMEYKQDHDNHRQQQQQPQPHYRHHHHHQEQQQQQQLQRQQQQQQRQRPESSMTRPKKVSDASSSRTNSNPNPNPGPTDSPTSRNQIERGNYRPPESLTLLTPEELGPGYRPGLERMVPVVRSPAEPIDRSRGGVDEYRVQKWLMDEKFNVGRLRRNRRRRRRRMRRRRHKANPWPTITARVRPPVLDNRREDVSISRRGLDSNPIAADGVGVGVGIGIGAEVGRPGAGGRFDILRREDQRIV